MTKHPPDAPGAAHRVGDSDVVIVGAGPVGLLLANLLGARGVGTRLFERRTHTPAHSMAIGITPPTLEILKTLGLDGVFREAGVPVRHAEVYERGSRIGRIDFAGIASDYPFFLSLPQTRTVEILGANLGKFPSVTRHDGHEFTGLIQEAGHVRAGFRPVAGGDVVEVAARFLVGADGPRSAVRSALGWPVREKAYPQRFIMGDFEDESGLGSEARLFFTPEASVESFPLPGGWRRWIVLGDRGSAGRPGDDLVGKVRRLTGYDLGGETPRSIRAFGARRMVVDSYHRGRVLLAGDAAHVMSSIGGQGMNTGMADAELLAAILPAVLEQPGRQADRFAAYDRLRRQAFEVAATRAERGMWLGTLRGRVASWCRRHFIRDVLFSRFFRRHLAPHFAMLTIPNRNLHGMRRAGLVYD